MIQQDPRWYDFSIEMIDMLKNQIRKVIEQNDFKSTATTIMALVRSSAVSKAPKA